MKYTHQLTFVLFCYHLILVVSGKRKSLQIRNRVYNIVTVKNNDEKENSIYIF